MRERETRLEAISTDAGALVGGSIAGGIVNTGLATAAAAQSTATFGGLATGVFATFANPVSIPAWAALVASPAGIIVLGVGLGVGGAHLGKKLGKWLNG